MRLVVRYGLLVVTAAVVQRAVFAELRIFGVAPDALLMLAVAAGFAGGSDRGAVVGFFSGLTLDLMTLDPVGLAALAYLVAGAVAGRLAASVMRSAVWLRMVLFALSCAVGIAVFGLVGKLLGRADTLGRHLLVVMLVTSVVGGLLGPLVVRACRWAEGSHDPYRAALR